jgi:hypothetical protein
MNIASFKNVFPVLLKHNIVPYLHGSHGLGKTQVVGQCTKELGEDFGFIPLYLATQEVGDLIGLMDKDQDSKTSYHMRPEWFPTSGKGVIFLDEFNRAHPDVLQAMFPFVLTRKMHTHTLPEGWHIVVAGNYNSNSYSTTDISDSALVSRFCHIDFKPTVEEFIGYAESKGADVIADFIRNHNEMLVKERKSEFDTSKIEPNPRAWMDFINPLENETTIDKQRFELYAGLVGTSAASSFISFKLKKEKTLSLKDILQNYPKRREQILEMMTKKEEVRLDYLNQPLKELESKMETNPKFLKEKDLANLKQFLLDIPMELALKTFKTLSEFNFTTKVLLLNDVEFCNKIANKR